MTKIFLTTLLIFCFLISNGQSLEGVLTYKVEFDIKTQKIGNFEITKEQVVQKMKSDGEYFDEIIVTIKNGNYEKTDNSDLQKRIVYKVDENKIYTFQKDFEYVIITDASKTHHLNLDLPEPSIEKIDSIKLINGHECKLLKLDWGKMGSELYFYDKEFLPIDPSLFNNHKYEYFNEVLKLTNAYPAEIVKSLSDFITVRMTLINVSEKIIDDAHFNLPDMKEAEKDYADMMRKMTG
jgi:hypothetical protein